MDWDSQSILSVLDRCCDSFSFPMLDNGYVYLAATRLSLYRSSDDWAMVVEVFGFSPRSGLPDTHLYTFASRLHDRDPADRFVNHLAFESYIANNPNNESRFVYPVEDGAWQDPDDGELVSETVEALSLRGTRFTVPPLEAYADHSIVLEQSPRVQVFELCRFLAATRRDDVLANPRERRVSVRPEMSQLLQLEEWHHPNLLEGERPSGSQTFQQLAEVVLRGEPDRYRPTTAPNTHWRNWPEGGDCEMVVAGR